MRTLKKLLPDDQLFRRFVEGDEEAFTLLFDRFAPRLLGYIRKMVGDGQRAEELVQETFLRIVRAAPRYEERGKFSSWVFTIATRLCFNESRLQKAVSLDGDLECSAGIGGGYENPEDRILGRIDEGRMLNRIESLLDALTDDHRAVFVLKHYQQKTYQEISEILEISEGTAKSRLHFALKRMRALVHRDRARAESGLARASG